MKEKSVSSLKDLGYSAALLDWTKDETKELENWTRKQLTAGRALHPKSNLMRVYIKRKNFKNIKLTVKKTATTK